MQKSKAQRILDDIMGSDRYAQVFSDRVFSDEPILRTGASAFRDRDKDRPSTGSATFVREMSATPSSGPLGAPQPPRKQIQVTPSSGAFGSPINIEYPSESNGQLKFSSGDHGNPDLPDPWLEDWGAEEAERVIPEPKGVSLPPALMALRRLERKGGRYSYGAAYMADSRLFYEQGKLVEDYTLAYEGSGATMIFGAQFPAYQNLTNYQLLMYFDFRTRFRAGETPTGPMAFWEILAFELIERIGCATDREGYDALCRLRDEYGPQSQDFAANIRRWIHDYVLFYGLDPEFAGEVSVSSRYVAAGRVLDAQNALLKLPACKWPGVGQPIPQTLPDAGTLLDSLCELSRYRAEKSRFFRERREEAATVTCRVFARMVDHCHKRRKKDYVQGLLGESSYMVYRVFPNSLFYSPRPHEDVEVKLGSETYKCERGFWYRELPVKVSDTSKELGNLLHTIDVRMRIAAGYPHLLKERTISKFQSKFIDEEIEAFIAERAAVEAATIRIDRFALDDIRTSSVRTREALLTDEERDDVLGALGPEAIHEAEEVSEPAPPVTHDSEPAVEVAEVAAPDSSDLPLTPAQLDILTKLLSGETVSEGAGPFLSLEIDAINECFLDIVGDTVVEYADDGYELVEDYAADVREALGC